MKVAMEVLWTTLSSTSKQPNLKPRLIILTKLRTTNAPMLPIRVKLVLRDSLTYLKTVLNNLNLPSLNNLSLLLLMPVQLSSNFTSEVLLRAHGAVLTSIMESLLLVMVLKEALTTGSSRILGAAAGEKKVSSELREEEMAQEFVAFN